MAPPSAPRIRSRPKARDGTLQFFWTTPLSDGGSALTAYVLACSAFSFSQTLGADATTYTVSGLTNGTDYTFTILARNADGDSPAVTFRTVQPGNFPSVPQLASISSINSGATALLNWSTPTSTGGADIRYYVTHTKNLTNAYASTIKTSLYPYTRSKTIQGLDVSASYVHYLYSVNDPGYSIPVTLYEIPSDPTLVVLLRGFRYSGSGDWINEANPSNNARVAHGTPTKNTEGNAVVLNGSTGFDINPIGVLGNWTISAWFKQTGPSQPNACLITDIYNGYSQYINFVFVSNIGTTPNVSDTQVAGGMYSAGNWCVNDPISNWDNWKHITTSWDGTTMKTYENGSLSSSSTFPGRATSGTNNGVRIGYRWDYTFFMVGELGEARIYGRALSANEVATAYAQSAGFFIS
jgi:hypothetical protein